MTTISPVGWFNLALAFALVFSAPLLERYTELGTVHRSLPARLRNVVDTLALGVVWAGYFLGLVPDVWIVDAAVVTLLASFAVYATLSLALDRFGYTRERSSVAC